MCYVFLFVLFFSFIITKTYSIHSPTLSEIIKENDGLEKSKFMYDSNDGTTREETIKIKNPNTENEETVISGYYQFITPEGFSYLVEYIANADGFKSKVTFLGRALGISSAAIATLQGGGGLG